MSISLYTCPLPFHKRKSFSFPSPPQEGTRSPYVYKKLLTLRAPEKDLGFGLLETCKAEPAEVCLHTDSRQNLCLNGIIVFQSRNLQSS